jgi:malate dehydrogenase (oxaloacetate-decarboxylating)(NADP+)
MAGARPIQTRMSDNANDLKQSALDYHRQDPPGKIKVAPTKPLVTQRDLALAYSPGVAYACEAIVEDPNAASEMTARGNLVAVITNGTAVLGLGDIGPLAGKPVMEGKGVLFQKFAGIDVFDIELDERDPDKLVDIIASMEPTFGGINLEDIKAPECFIVERKLRERMKIPVFHDDQHGTAIIVGSAVLNALEIVGKKIGEVKLATSGAGAAGIACLDMLVALGMKPENILAVDRDGVLHTGRANMDPDKARYARDTDKRTLADIVAGADVFLGLSAGGVLKPEMVATMAERPIILALANPNPEILPEDAKKVRPDCIIATGRSDYPNQVNNALCFPYIFRGALDVGATEINEAMKLACVRAIAALARMEASDLGSAYGGEVPKFGADYIIPRPFDPRLLTVLAPAVAQAAMDSGVAQRPMVSLDAYREKLGQFIYRTGLLMKPIYDRARSERKRVVYAEGEEETVLQAVQTVIDEQLARPILIGRPEVIETRIQRLGLRMQVGVDFDLTNINDDPRFNDYWQHYHALTERRGVTPAAAKNLLRSRPSLIAAIMVERGDDLRPGRPLPQEARLPAQRHRFRQGRRRHGRDDRRHQQPGRVVLPRHPRAGGPVRRADRRSHAAGQLPAQAVRHRAQGRAAVAFELRQPRQPERGEDASRLRDHPRARAEARDRRRDDGRHRVGRRAAQAHVPEHHAQRSRQPVRDAEPGRGEHHLQHGARDDRRRGHRPDPDGPEPTGAHPDAGIEPAPRGQHDRDRRGGSADPQAALIDVLRTMRACRRASSVRARRWRSILP